MWLVLYYEASSKVLFLKPNRNTKKSDKLLGWSNCPITFCHLDKILKSLTQNKTTFHL